MPLFSFPYGKWMTINKVPFEYIHYQGLFCFILTEYGPKKFLIDTGTTITILRASSFPNLITKQLTENHLPETTLTLFQLGHKNYANQHAFLIQDLKLDYFDGILGMDFFYDKTLFFDMDHKMLYIK